MLIKHGLRNHLMRGELPKYIIFNFFFKKRDIWKHQPVAESHLHCQLPSLLADWLFEVLFACRVHDVPLYRLSILLPLVELQL